MAMPEHTLAGGNPQLDPWLAGHHSSAAVAPTLPVVVVHYSRTPVVQSPGTLVVNSNRVLVRLSRLRQFEPQEPVLLITGQAGDRRAARAVIEGCDHETASLRIDGAWRPFDQRQSRRYDCTVTARILTLSGLWGSRASVVNISRGGLGLTCRDVPPVPAVMVVLGEDDRLSLPCRVTTKRPTEDRTFLLGAKFINFGPARDDVEAEVARASAFELATGLVAFRVPASPERAILEHRRRR
jgi:hypothetical protein